MENAFEREVLDRLIKIEAKLESWDKSKQQIYDNQREIIKVVERQDQQQKELEEMLERNKWLSRTAISAVIGSVISAIVAVVMTVV
ncbi:MAG: hemolysin XhlA family protein [Lachnospiraceae bacterium]|nr:hemolysin XhlA family protein [Lachnospiraceae bacterium]